MRRFQGRRSSERVIPWEVADRCADAKVDPVTTDRRHCDVRSHSVRPAGQSMNAIRRRPLAQQSRVPLGIHLRYVDGEGCFTVSISRERVARRLGGEAELLGQPERRSCRGASCDPGVLRVRKHPADAATDLKWETRRLEESSSGSFRTSSGSALSGKRYDFERFASICRLMADGAHRAATVSSRSSSSLGR